jgi:hypothetical protein
VLGHEHFEQFANVIEFGHLLPGRDLNAGLRQHGTVLLARGSG